MDKKKLITNIIFQLAAISVISSFFIFDYLDISKIKFSFSNRFYGLIILLLFLKIFIASLFYIIINTISKKEIIFLIYPIHFFKVVLSICWSQVWVFYSNIISLKMIWVLLLLSILSVKAYYL